MKTSIIISYYKNEANLELILLALDRQSFMAFEVIIAEDDANPNTHPFLERMRLMVNYPIHRVAQTADEGFRKNMMLNKAILKSTGDLLIFIDGDCVPHHHFVKAYVKANAESSILYGRRVMLGAKRSADLLTKRPFTGIPFWKVLFSDSELKKEGIYWPWFKLNYKTRGLLGCNWAVKKTYLLAINGYDEDYTAAGVGEDVDVEWRLKAIGLKMVSMKNKAIVYHLYHPRSYSEDGVQENYRKMAEKQAANQIECKNGLRQIND